MKIQRKSVVNLKIINNKLLRGFITAGVFFAGLVFDIILMSGTPNLSRQSAWGTAGIWVENSNFVPAGCFILIVLVLISVALGVVGSVLAFSRKRLYIWPFGAFLASHVLMVVIIELFNVFDNKVLILLSLLASLGGFIFGLVCGINNPHNNNSKRIKASDNKLKKGLSVLSVISAAVTLALFYIPLCSYIDMREEFSIVAMGVFTSKEDNIISLVLFVLLFVFTAINTKLLLNYFRRTDADDEMLSNRARNIVNLNTVVAGAYFFAGVIICSVNNSDGGNFFGVSVLPFLIMIVIAFVCAFLTRKQIQPKEEKQERTAKAARIEMFIYSTLVAVITVITALSDIIKVNFDNNPAVDTIHLNGYDIFMTYNSLESGFQMIAFVLFIVLALMVSLFLISVITLIGKSKYFFKVNLWLLVSGTVCSLIIGLFGKYYEIVQQINEDIVRAFIVDQLGTRYSKIDYTVQSQAFFWFIAAMAVVVVALIRKPYSKGTVGETPIMVGNTVPGGSVAPSLPQQNENEQPYQENTSQSTRNPKDTDPCPAFTELDLKENLFDEQRTERQEQAFGSPSLPELVQFVVSYARDCRLHLSYTPEDIATFVAGLGATKLTILQGMSGTGKTSLPKIFSEAILGTCDIIEVESSWRDKNELLGYYNEFSKTYTPKKFTQALYKARLNPDILTFIVLDEMNLSRIEYYFSDFLSLMENEEDKREIKLLNVGLHRVEDGKVYEYSGLFEGHTIRVPNNIWFIGTANRDESTFEISDKVYDRAHTMNFNKRAAKPLAYGQPVPQRYLSSDAFIELIENAKAAYGFNIDQHPIIKDVEALLAPYNISFGNRIAKQIENFVSIYCACFSSPEDVVDDAVEKILLSKVVSKLEYKSVENKVQLASEFEKLKLYRCSEFIMKLNED